jgi:hypothetical protein
MFEDETEDEEDGDFELMALESLTVDKNTCFEEIELEDGMYIFMFEMADVQNNDYLSDVAVFSVEDGEIYLLEDD